MAGKGHDRKHCYVLNQISYYIASNHDYRCMVNHMQEMCMLQKSLNPLSTIYQRIQHSYLTWDKIQSQTLISSVTGDT